MRRTLLLLCTAAAVVLPYTAVHAESQAAYFLRHIPRDRVLKSGTPLFMKLAMDGDPDARAFRAAFPAGPRQDGMDHHADSPAGRFRVYYTLTGANAPNPLDTGGNGVPDYVDSTLVYLDHAWYLLMNELGYDPPLSDGDKGGLGTQGQSLVDCYLMELSGQQLYGFTMTDNGQTGPASSYLTIDNDYKESIYSTNGMAALKVTTAHEFFHVIHYSYWGRFDSVWWMEQSAVWFEDYTWDDVNDYLAYLGYFLSNRDVPLDTSNGSFEYGAALFPMMLADQYGTGIIRSVWNTMRTRRNGEIEVLSPIIPGGLANAVGDLAVWSWFTGHRANPADFFEESAQYPSQTMPSRTFAATTLSDSLEVRHYAFKYVDIAPPGGFASGDILDVGFLYPDGGDWRNRLILYNSPTDYTDHALNSAGDAVIADRAFNRAVLALVNTSVSSKTYRVAFSLNIPGAHDAVPGPFAVGPNYPNPFNASTTIPFDIPARGRVTLKVYGINGALAAVLMDGTLTAGSHTAEFDGAGLGSGTYIAVLETGGRRTAAKMIFLK